MGFQTNTTNHTKVTKLERNALLGKGMDLNSLTWLLVTCVLFQMYTTPTLIQSTCSFGDATTWHPDQIHLPIFFQRVMDQVFEGANFMKCYIDDVLVHSKGFLQHLAHLEELFKRLHEIDMKIHPKKCEFAVTSVVYLGHRILPNGIMAHWSKIVTILEMPNLTDVHTLRSFIGLCNYHKIYVQDFSTIVHPLYALLKKDVAWTWSDEA